MFTRVLLAGIFLILITAFAGLGFWQLDRAEQKRTLFAAFDADGAVATELPDGNAADEQRYARLELTGHYESSRQILLDWMTHEGQVGYQVLTPFNVTNTDCWVMVNRGWVAGAADHIALPAVGVNDAERTIRGRIDALPRPGLRRSVPQDSAPTAWPRPLLYPTIEAVEAELGLPIMRYQLLLNADEPDGFVRAWRPRVLPPDNHVGYAVQWFAMALVLAGIGIGLLVRSARSTPQAGGSR